jgi:CheY-like chemotaxis protein
LQGWLYSNNLAAGNRSFFYTGTAFFFSIQATTTMTKSTIVYADDDLDDLFVVEQAFAPFADYVKLVHVPNGNAALTKLEELCATGEEPCLVLLDMNMPVMDGRQALIRMRKSERLCKIPVAIFTTSSSTVDKAFAQQWDARYFTKPIQFDELQHLAKTFISMCADEVGSS